MEAISNDGKWSYVECSTCGANCACGDGERALRHIVNGTWPHGSMTAEQRAWCVEEADSAGEGAYKLSELEALNDQDLARTVLDAWTDYCRSQGLL